MTEKRAITAEEFDRRFDAGEDISDYIDWESARRPLSKYLTDANVSEGRREKYTCGRKIFMSNQRGLTLETPDHYDLPIQPVEYVVKNALGYLEGNVIKYVTRHHDKGQEEDIKKAIHYLTLVLRTEYGIDTSVTYTPTQETLTTMNPQGAAFGPIRSGEIATNYYRRYANVH